MPIDILLFAAIAVFFVWKLRQTLGTRHGDERERQNPFAQTLESEKEAAERQAEHAAEDGSIIDGDARDVTPDSSRPVLAAPPASLAGGITQLRILDPNFDEKKFLSAAKQAFTMIIESFSRADMPTLEMLLSPAVLDGFRREIERRQQAGEVFVTDVRRIVTADIGAARTEGKKAYLTVDFTSEQISYVKNQAGEIIDGDSNQPLEISESWTFQRDTTNANPNWQLVATRQL